MSNGEGTISSLLGKISIRNLVFYMVSLAFIVVIYLKWGEVVSIREIFLRSHISWLLVAIFLQGLTYYFLALNYRYIFKIKGHEASVWSLYPLAFITQFLNQVFPSAGISGQIFLIDYLKRRGSTVVDGIGRAILEIASLFTAFGAIFIIGSVLFFITGDYIIHPQFIYLMYIFWFFATIALWIFFSLQRSGENGLFVRIFSYFMNKEESKKKKAKPGKIKEYWTTFTSQLRGSLSVKSMKSDSTDKLFLLAVLWQGIILFLDILTLYALSWALDIQVSFFTVFIAFTFTQFISMLSFVPGALLVYEGSLSLILILFGVERGAAFTLALVFRVLIFWLPMPIGWLLYRQHENQTVGHTRPAQGPA